MTLKYSITVDVKKRFFGRLYRTAVSPTSIAILLLIGVLYFWIFRGIVLTNGREVSTSAYIAVFLPAFVVFDLLLVYGGATIEQMRVKRTFNVQEVQQHYEINKSSIKIKTLSNTTIFKRQDIRHCIVRKHAVFFRMRQLGFSVFFNDNRQAVIDTLQKQGWMQ